MSAPSSVRRAAALWIFAVAAGVFETVVAVTGILASGAFPAGAVAVGVGLRLVVFGAAVFMTLRLRAGDNLARLGLAVLLGLFGTLSLVVGPVQDLLAGTFTLPAGPADWLLAVSRAAHLVAVLAAMVLMFRPEANAYFDRRRSAISL
ncbi:hypothetical protein [Nonomuraea longicatena]|uniref:Integral membrane protein n=1 Tax=Nonomuraea longicatena TaxID=83682 RepID=A0ABN1QT54_9ACTN